jgi:hypothetical protein
LFADLDIHEAFLPAFRYFAASNVAAPSSQYSPVTGVSSSGVRRGRL